MCNYKKRLNLSWACSGTYGQCLSNGLVLPPCYHPCSTLPSVPSAALICFPHSSRSRSHSLTFSIALTYSSITLFHPLFILRFLSLIPFTPSAFPTCGYHYSVVRLFKEMDSCRDAMEGKSSCSYLLIVSFSPSHKSNDPAVLSTTE